LFASRSNVADLGHCRIERGCKARWMPGESDKCDGIWMDSLITVAARALAAGDPLTALKRIALRGITMAQFGNLARAKGLARLRRCCTDRPAGAVGRVG
jgi:hypothetical protein